MKVENLPVSVYFMTDPETFEDEWIKDLPGNYDETDPDGRDFFETSTKIVYPHFMRSCRNMAPLLVDKRIASMSIGIDALGFLSGHASYINGRSDSTTGNYKFVASRSLLRSYLQAYWEPDFSLNPLDTYVWEHEIIHMLDHKNIIGKKSFPSIGLRKFWVEHFLEYRQEGIAEMYMFAKGHNEARNMGKAYELFKEDLKSYSKSVGETNSALKSFDNLFREVSHPYSVGPWLVLHALSLTGEKNIKSFVEKISKHISNGETLSEKETITLIRYALQLKNDLFITSLTKQGLNEMEFLLPEEIEELNGILKIINKIECNDGKTN
jgi:hypothetical protein